MWLTLVAVQSGLEFAAGFCQLEEGDVTVRVAHEAMLGRRIVA